MQKTTIRYIPIGDSYTIGEGIPEERSWPSLLTHHLQQEGTAIQIIANPSQTGWTTQDAIDHELPIYTSHKLVFG